MNHHQIIATAWIGAVAVGVNIPLGYFREAAPRYSARWFLFVHLSIPLVAALRITNRLTPWAIPVFVACAVAGQIVGGRVRRRRDTGT